MLLLPATQNQSVNPHTTNESITSVEEEGASVRSYSETAKDVQYAVDKGNVIIETQITDPNLYSYIVGQAEERKSDLLRRPGTRKIKDQVRVQYKVEKEEADRARLSRSKEEGDDNSLIPKSELSETAKSVQNEKEIPQPEIPIPPPPPRGKKQLKIDAPSMEPDSSLENFGGSSIGSGKGAPNEPSPEGEEGRFIFPPTPQQRDEDKTLMTKLEEIGSLKQKAVEYEKTEHKLKNENEELGNELAKFQEMVQTLVAEKADLATRLKVVLNVSKESTATNTDKAKLGEYSVQTEGGEAAAMQKLRVANAGLEAKLRVSEKEKVELASAMERQQMLLAKAETEMSTIVRENKTISTELEATRLGLDTQKKSINGLKADLNTYKSRTLKLESENKELMRLKRPPVVEDKSQLIAELKEQLNRYEQLTGELSKENDAHKGMLAQTKEQLAKAGAEVEERKHGYKRQREKAKELKKERDLLKIEILKLKQMYSDKCDGYKDARDRLQKRLKEKEEVIMNLQDAIGDRETAQKLEKEHTLQWAQGREEGADEYMRGKSLENTNKYNFKDLSATLQPGEIKKKLEDIAHDNQFSVDAQMSPLGPPTKARQEDKSAIRSNVEINDFITTHKVGIICLILVAQDEAGVCGKAQIHADHS